MTQDHKTKLEYIKFAHLLEKERVLREKILELQKTMLNGGRWTSTERRNDGLTISIPLPELIAMFPGAKSELVKWEQEDGRVTAYHRFGPEHLAELKPGFQLWVKHETKSTEVVPAAKAATPEYGTKILQVC